MYGIYVHFWNIFKHQKHLYCHSQMLQWHSLNRRIKSIVIFKIIINISFPIYHFNSMFFMNKWPCETLVSLTELFCGQGRRSCLRSMRVPCFLVLRPVNKPVIVPSYVRLTSHVKPRPRQALTHQLRLIVKNRNFQDGWGRGVHAFRSEQQNKFPQTSKS